MMSWYFLMWSKCILIPRQANLKLVVQIFNLKWSAVQKYYELLFQVLVDTP
jgi:hypothetical protein